MMEFCKEDKKANTFVTKMDQIKQIFDNLMNFKKSIF